MIIFDIFIKNCKIYKLAKNVLLEQPIIKNESEMGYGEQRSGFWGEKRVLS